MRAHEILEQFRAAGRKITPDLEAVLQLPSARDELYSCFHLSPSSLEPELLRVLLEMEVSLYRSAGGDADCDRLYWCVFLLSKCGRTQDVLPIWRVKQTDFDTGCGLDIQFAIGPGLEETIQFLAQSPDPDARVALEYITACKESGNFDDMESWRAGRDHYFRPRD